MVVYEQLINLRIMGKYSSSSKTSNDVRSSEESARDEVGCGGNEDAETDVWTGVTKVDIIRNERIRGTAKVGEISKKLKGSTSK